MVLDRRRRLDQRGSSLIMAIVVMLTLGVLGLSFAILADLESRVGLNHKAAAQAFALAEAGLQHGRNLVAGATAAGSFNAWVDNAANGSLLTVSPVSLGGGSYQVRIDNDCGALVPAPLTADSGCTVAVGTGRDRNETAILTAWATVTGAAGNVRGRARIRAWTTNDDPWKHVCSSNDEPCYSGGGNPTVEPNNPGDPNAPATYNTLPTPCVGTSTTACPSPLGGLPSSIVDQCAPTIPGGAGNRMVMPHFFLAALRTSMPAGANWNMPAPPVGPNTRPAWDGTSDPPNGCGLVVDNRGQAEWRPGQGGGGPRYLNTTNTNVAPFNPVLVYVTGRVDFQNDVYFTGTLVVHGDGVGGSGPNVDLAVAPFTCFNKDTSGGCSGSSSRNPAFNLTNQATPGGAGYPLALLVYDPNQTVPPPDQNTVADVSDNNVFISGIMYSGGSIQFNPISVDGGVVAHNIQFQSSSATYTYNKQYGNDAPPLGFPPNPVYQSVLLIRRTYSHCRTYNDDSGGPTTCN